MVFEGFRDRFVVLFERVATTFRYIASIISKCWQTIRPTVISIYKVHCLMRQMQRKAFFKKKKSQRKNWKKWKKRK